MKRLVFRRLPLPLVVFFALCGGIGVCVFGWESFSLFSRHLTIPGLLLAILAVLSAFNLVFMSLRIREHIQRRERTPRVMTRLALVVIFLLSTIGLGMSIYGTALTVRDHHISIAMLLGAMVFILSWLWIYLIILIVAVWKRTHTR